MVLQEHQDYQVNLDRPVCLLYQKQVNQDRLEPQGYQGNLEPQVCKENLVKEDKTE